MQIRQQNFTHTKTSLGKLMQIVRLNPVNNRQQMDFMHFTAIIKPSSRTISIKERRKRLLQRKKKMAKTLKKQV